MEFILKIGIGFFNILYSFLKLFPAQNKVVFISRQSNTPSLDIEMLSKKITHLHSDYKVVILCKKLEGNILNKVSYCFHMLTQMYHLATSRVVILDSYSILVSVLNHKSSLLVIQMWHSVGTMKKFGYSILDMPEGSSSKIAHLMKMHHNYDYILCAGEGYKSHLAEGFNYPEDRIKILPLPRVEALKDQSFINSKCEEIFAAYPHLKYKKNIVYAPTFRKNYDEQQRFLNAILSLFSLFPIGRNSVVQSLPSPGGTYCAQVIDSDQGALGGDTIVEVYEPQKRVNLLLIELRKDPQLVYLGNWGEFENMNLRWESEQVLLINGRSYEVE